MISHKRGRLKLCLPNNNKMIQINDYSIQVGSFDTLIKNFNLDSYSKVMVLVDENTSQFCLPFLFENIETRFKILEIPSGEIYKNLDTCELIWQGMMDKGLDRESLVINLGGGVICDMGGFCAATYMRGIDFIHIPTTLLSQVDSSIGGKLGVDLGSIKNMVGVFRDPKAVLICTEFLLSLPYRQLVSGFAEIIKHALIADSILWQDIIQTKDINSMNMEEIVAKSLQIKAKVVRQDPYEVGIRKTLNFGHTIGHAIESYALQSNKPLLHGEAVSIGMICESFIAFTKKMIKESDLQQIVDNILYFYGDKSKTIQDIPAIINNIKYDKKNTAGQIQIATLSQIGHSEYNVPCTEEELVAALQYYKNISNAN